MSQSTIASIPLHDAITHPRPGPSHGDDERRAGFGNGPGDYTESYAYDGYLDYLTSASYSDAWGFNGSWTYDAAGNRANSGYAYDALNRMTNSPGSTDYEHDAAGNRILRTTPTTESTYNWDALNRMTSATLDGGEWESTQSMLYRPDGLLHRKVTNYTGLEPPSGYSDFNQDLDNPTTWLRYDGQMTFEGKRAWTSGYTLGPRGFEMMEAEQVSTNIEDDPLLNAPVRSFPLYDGHGI